MNQAGAGVSGVLYSPVVLVNLMNLLLSFLFVTSFCRNDGPISLSLTWPGFLIPTMHQTNWPPTGCTTSWRSNGRAWFLISTTAPSGGAPTTLSCSSQASGSSPSTPCSATPPTCGYWRSLPLFTTPLCIVLHHRLS